MNKKILRTLSLVFLILGIFIGTSNITGAVIGYSTPLSFSLIFGFVCLLISITLIFLSKEDDDLTKILIKDKNGKIKFIDPNYIFYSEIKADTRSKTADEVLKELDEILKGEDELKEVYKDQLEETGYIDAARRQRDICKDITSGIGRVADDFLKKWDNNYKAFEKPKNPLLVYDEKDAVSPQLPGQRNIFDTREILRLMKNNIEGFEIVDNPIGNHDVMVSYKNAQFQVMAGSDNPYEVPRRNIQRTIRRIVREDVRAKRINDDEQNKRYEVLMTSIFN
ncbi:hypothetical protein ACFL1H_01135 [Nanoarchaeota archaeon]